MEGWQMRKFEQGRILEGQERKAKILEAQEEKKAGLLRYIDQLYSAKIIAERAETRKMIETQSKLSLPLSRNIYNTKSIGSKEGRVVKAQHG